MSRAIHLAKLLVLSLLEDVRRPRATTALGRDGYVVLDGFVDDATCDDLARALVELVDRTDEAEWEPGDGYREGRWPSGASVHVRERGYDVGFLDVHEIDREVAGAAVLRAAAEPLELVEAASGRPFRVLNVHGYVTRDATNPRVVHCDSIKGAVRQYKAFLYLADVALEDGPYSYVRSSNRFTPWRQVNLVANFLRRRPFTDMRLHARRKVVRFVAPKGTLVITDQTGFHGGVPQQPGRQRLVLVNNYVEA